MIKDVIESNKNIDVSEIKTKKLKEIFPGAFHGDNIDFEYIQNQLKNVKVTKEGYELNFLGKTYAKLLAALDTETVIVPDLEHNQKKENQNTNNIFITADNLDALKHLLKSYWKKVDVIYIDPPYNTGTDGFVYNDDFKFTRESLIDKLGVSEEEADRVLEMTSIGSSSHSAWLTFMFPRLYLARQLLKDEGMIFISIDDHEVPNLRLLCDDLYGENNFINQVIWQRNSSGKTVSRQLQTNIEYLLIYGKSENYIINPIFKPLAESTIKMYSKDDGDGRGKYRLYPLQKTASPGPETTYDYIDNSGKVWKCPAKGWRMIQPKLKALENDGRLYFEANSLSEKAYWNERDNEGRLADTLWNDLSENSAASKEISTIFGASGVFDTPKPIDLIERCIRLADKDDLLVMDFFAGSASTADAVLHMNAQDGKNRKYILVQLAEEIKPEKPAYQLGFRNISEIGRKRIEVVAQRYLNELVQKRENAGLIQDNIVDPESFDYGYKHFIINRIEDKKIDLLDSFNPSVLFTDRGILDQFDSNTVIATWKNLDGYGLIKEWSDLKLAEYNAYQIEGTVYLLNPDISNEAIKALLERYEDDSFYCNKIVMFGYSFTMSEIQSIKDNLKQVESIRHLTLDIIVRY